MSSNSLTSKMSPTANVRTPGSSTFSTGEVDPSMMPEPLFRGTCRRELALIPPRSPSPQLRIIQSTLRAIDEFQTEFDRIMESLRLQIEVFDRYDDVNELQHTHFSPVPTSRFDPSLVSRFSVGTSSASGTAQCSSPMEGVVFSHEQIDDVSPNRLVWPVPLSSCSSPCTSTPRFHSARSWCSDGADELLSWLYASGAESPVRYFSDDRFCDSPEVIYPYSPDPDVLAQFDAFRWPPSNVSPRETSSEPNQSPTDGHCPISPPPSSRSSTLQDDDPFESFDSPRLDLNELVRMPSIGPWHHVQAYRDLPSPRMVALGEVMYMLEPPASGPSAFFREMPLRRTGWGLLDTRRESTVGMRRLGIEGMHSLILRLWRPSSPINEKVTRIESEGGEESEDDWSIEDWSDAEWSDEETTVEERVVVAPKKSATI